MVLHFKNNIDLSNIKDSMQLVSDQVVAELKTDNFLVTLEVKGLVTVLYNPDPNGDAEDGQVYNSASEFPPELMDIFAQGKANELPNICVNENNWFEAFVEFTNTNESARVLIGNELVDAEGLNEREVFEMLYDIYSEYWEEDRLLSEITGVLKKGNKRGVYDHRNKLDIGVSALGESTILKSVYGDFRAEKVFLNTKRYILISGYDGKDKLKTIPISRIMRDNIRDLAWSVEDAAKKQ